MITQDLALAALLDPDAAGDNAVSQDGLMHSFGEKTILRTNDHREAVWMPKIENLLRTTLVIMARDALGIGIVDQVAQRRQQPIVDMLGKADKSFSKYRLSKAFLRWSRDHEASDLTDEERSSWIGLVNSINAALK